MSCVFLSIAGLASNAYEGHSFWDCETWMYPGLLMLHPDIGRSLLEYRVARLDEARAKAKSYDAGYEGAMFPWESGATGVEVCPTSAATGQLEQHVSGDIVFAAAQYFLATGDEDWLASDGLALASGVADFYASRVEVDENLTAHINDVIPPDEYAEGDFVSRGFDLDLDLTLLRVCDSFSPHR